MLNKQSIFQINNVYTANAFKSGHSFYVGAGSETDPVVKLLDLATGTCDELEDCPGGMMSFLPVPGRTGSYVSIMGLFPPFIGKEAGIYFHRRTPEGWKTHRVVDLPFAHRCEFIQLHKRPLLVAASVSKFKEDPADWSRPGELYLITPGESSGEMWESRMIDGGITRNHGMIRTVLDGLAMVCVSGAEGIFNLAPTPSGTLELNRLFDREVSEMTFVDLDGDGSPELITIEPFHGTTLNMYKRIKGEWKLKFSDTLSFGHGLSGGLFNGSPVIVAGNRSGSLALETFTINDLDKGAVNRMVIEADAGPTQTQVFSYGKRDYLLSANQRKNEVALYTGSM